MPRAVADRPVFERLGRPYALPTPDPEAFERTGRGEGLDLRPLQPGAPGEVGRVGEGGLSPLGADAG